MVASVSSPAQLANNAFVRMGFKLRVGSLYDGSDHARHTIDIYAQTRDELLRSFDYDFAQRSVALTLLKTAPPAGYFPPNLWDPALHPPPGWAFEYGYPTDSLKILIVKPPPLFVTNYDPQSFSWQESNDNSFTPSRRVILTSVPGAIANYSGQVTDPALWDVAFVEAMAAALERRLATILAPAAARQAAADEMAETQIAQREDR